MLSKEFVNSKNLILLTKSLPHTKGVHRNSGYFETLIISGRLKITQDKLGYFDYFLTQDD